MKPPALGTDDDRNGERLDFLSTSGSMRIMDDSDEPPSGGVGVSPCATCTELLLRRGGKSMVSSKWFLEKKVLLDAVIGVVGVLGSWRDGGGLRSRSTELSFFLSRLGMLRGPRLMGGRLRGCRFLRSGGGVDLLELEAVLVFAVVVVVVGARELLRSLRFR